MDRLIRKRWLFDFLAVCLALFTHFANYITYIDYSFVSAEVLLSFGLLLVVSVLLAALLQLRIAFLRTIVFSALILIVLSEAIFEFGTREPSLWLHFMIFTMIGTLVLVFLLREHINKVLFVVFSVMLGTTLALQPIDSEDQGIPAAEAADISELPVVVHLVLDEHMGPAGMTPALPGAADVRQELTAFYVENGFRLYSHAYSEYFDTHASIASAFNHGATGAIEDLAERVRDKIVLFQNRYFEHWASAGFRIHVLQSSYFDLCQDGGRTISTCRTYHHDAFDQASIVALPFQERSALLWKMYYSSFTLLKLVRLSEYGIRRALAGRDLQFEGFGLWHGRIGPLAVSGHLERLTNQIAHSKGGDFFFAHLLMPHHPYVYDPSCRLRPSSEWLMRARGDGSNSPAERVSRYTDYFQQVECGLDQMRSLFDAMRRSNLFETAIVIIHGDHGSRIMRLDPKVENRHELTIEDYIDAFSTLFAVKMPGMQPGVDKSMLSLPDILNSVVTDGTPVPEEGEARHIYLRDKSGSYVRSPIPAFPN